MPVNRNALIRYKTIDSCLRNRFKRWALDDLIDACSEALYEYEGIDKGVSRRTVQLDIQMMRSEKLGYNAPIEVIDKKFYIYSDPDYSITNIPLTDKDLGKLTEVVDILRQFKGFRHFQELRGMIQKLEDKIHVSKTHERAIIDMEKNENLRGLEFIDPLYRIIQHKKIALIKYQSFNARQPQSYHFHPILLKEYRNRWFVMGKVKQEKPPLLLALDRIQDVEESEYPAMEFEESLTSNFFEHVIGATVNIGEQPEEVLLAFTRKHAPYVLTKPLHHSQQLVEKSDGGIIVSLRVQHNFELEKSILEFGDGVRVISPARLKRKIKERLTHAIDEYNTELNLKMMSNLPRQLGSRGSAILNHVYSKKSQNRIGKMLHQYISANQPESEDATHAIRELFLKIPDLKPLIYTQNLLRIIESLLPKAFLIRATYFNKPPQKNWYVTWHQDTSIHVTEKTDINGYNGWTKKGLGYGVIPPDDVLRNNLTIRIHLDETNENNGALNILPGSHSRKFSKDEIDLLTRNALPTTCDIGPGGIHLMKPLLLHASSKSKNQKNRRVIHLEFSNQKLPGALNYAEKEDL